jgi:hypothetical protein
VSVVNRVKSAFGVGLFLRGLKNVLVVDHERVLVERVVHHKFSHADRKSELLEEHVVRATARLIVISFDADHRRLVIRNLRGQRQGISAVGGVVSLDGIDELSAIQNRPIPTELNRRLRSMSSATTRMLGTKSRYSGAGLNVPAPSFFNRLHAGANRQTTYAQNSSTPIPIESPV